MHRRRLCHPTTLYLLVALLLLWLTLRQVTFTAIWYTLAQLQVAQICNLLVLNGLVLATMVIRWHLLLHAQGHRIPAAALLQYRLAAFGVTYFTPGPQFGGEPLQVYLVHERHGVPLQDAIAAVALDKVLEMLVNFGFLVAGVLLLLSQGLLAGAVAYGGLATALFLLALPLLLFLAFLRRKRPLQHMVAWLNPRMPAHPRWWQRVATAAVASESQAIHLCERRPLLLFGAFGITLVGWALMLLEFGYATRALGAPLAMREIILVLIAARVAYLLPMPAGIGTFESALALAFQWLHHDPATGLALSLLIRSRDLALGGAGLWLGGIALRMRQPTAALQAITHHVDDSQASITEP